MSVVEAYTYEPLDAPDSIRLINLDPATSFEAPLICSIAQYQSDDPVAYDAVSYAWESAQPSQILQVRHDQQIYHLKIRPNVDSLLRHLREPCIALRYLWIDAICLNQDDDLEKAHQIPRMGSIYESANEVHIWLGLEDSMTAKIFMFFRNASALSAMKPGVEASERVAAALNDVFGRSSPNWWYENRRIVTAFFNRPWFFRRWIIQEASLANHATCHCGPHSVNLRHLARTAAHMQHLGTQPYPVMMASRFLSRQYNQSSVLDLLWQFHEAVCRDPRDRIAAFLGLMKADELSDLPPEVFTYHWTELFKTVAVMLLERGSNEIRMQLAFHLIEFGAVPQTESTDPSYPSWVPNWSNTRNHSLMNNSTRYENEDPRMITLVGLGRSAFPDNQNRVQLIFDPLQDTLRASWNDELYGLGGRRVVYKRLQRCSDTRKSNNRRLSIEDRIKDLQEFTGDVCARDQTTLIHCLSRMIGALQPVQPGLHYIETQDEGEKAFVPHKIFAQTLAKPLPVSLTWRQLSPLYDLDQHLEGRCLFRLSQDNIEMPIHGKRPWVYGLAPPLIDVQVGDVLVPLGDITWGPSHLDWLAHSGKQAFLALIVRCRDADVGHLKHPKDTPDRTRELTGRIVGPAIAVTARTAAKDGDANKSIPTQSRNISRVGVKSTYSICLL